MKKHYYCLFDKIANDFISLFLANNDKVAIRMLSDSIKQNPAHCEDLEIYYICSFSADYCCLDFTKPIKVASVVIDDQNKPQVLAQNEVIE